MLNLIHIFLLVALTFAVLVGLLLLGYLCRTNHCNSPQNLPSDDEEEGGILFSAAAGNNNNNDGRSDSVHQVQEEMIPLRSRPSAPLLTDVSQNDVGGMSRTMSRQSVNSHRVIEDIRAIQNSLIRNDITYTASSEDGSSFNLIIGVDAQPGTFGGYCISLKGDEEDKWVEFYSIQREHLPWRFGEDLDDTELEAKNFLFALMLWSEAIVEAKRILIYTGNHAVIYDNNRFGRRATKFIEHYSQCEGVIVGNDYRFLVNWRRDPKSYAEHILPAEDLSSGNLREFHDFVSRYYDVSLFRGTHYIPPFKPRNEQEVGFETVDNYSGYVERVRRQMSAWTEPCSRCGYVDDETASMLSINRIPS